MLNDFEGSFDAAQRREFWTLYGAIGVPFTFAFAAVVVIYLATHRRLHRMLRCGEGAGGCATLPPALCMGLGCLQLRSAFVVARLGEGGGEAWELRLNPAHKLVVYGGHVNEWYYE